MLRLRLACLRLQEGRAATDMMGTTQIEITPKQCLEMRGTFVVKDKDL